MPIKTPNQIIRIECNKCGWHLIVNKGGVADCLVGYNLWKFTTNNVGSDCPKCGSRKLSETTASTLNQINPIEYIRKLHHTLFNKTTTK